MWPDTMGCLPRQKTTRLHPCGVCLCHAPSIPFISSIRLLTYTQPLFFSTFLHSIPSHSLCALPFHLLPPFMSPGTQSQQAFRSEPRNLTVRMGATAVLRCEVLRASGTVQWVKDGLLLGPQRGLPGFPRYSMIGNPKRGKQGYSRNKVYGLLGFD